MHVCVVYTQSTHPHPHSSLCVLKWSQRTSIKCTALSCSGCVMPLRPGLTLKLDISRFDPAHTTSHSSATSSVYMGDSDLKSGPRACVTNALTCQDIFYPVVPLLLETVMWVLIYVSLRQKSHFNENGCSDLSGGLWNAYESAESIKSSRSCAASVLNAYSNWKNVVA